MSETATSYWNPPVESSDPEKELDFSGKRIDVEIINEITAFRNIKSEWNALVAKSCSTFFQSFAWQYLWWTNYGYSPGNHLHIVLFRKAGKLVGIAPFLIRSISLFQFKIFRQLLFLGSGLHSPDSPVLSLEKQGPSDYLDVIAETGVEQEVAQALAIYLKQHQHLWDELELQNIPEKSITMTYLLPLMDESQYMVDRSVEDVCPVLPLTTTLDELLLSLRRSVRRNLRYGIRNFLENPEYQVEDVIRSGKIDAAFQGLTQLHQKRWNAIGYPGLFVDKRFTSLLQSVINSQEDTGEIWFKVLRKDGKSIAANLGFMFNGRFHGYASGFDRDALTQSANSGAGSALIFLSVIDSINSSLKVLDFGRGSEEYKFQLTSAVSRNFRIVLSRNSSDGKIFGKKVFRVKSNLDGLHARALCEASIFKSLSRGKSLRQGISGYISHVSGRLATRQQRPLESGTKDVNPWVERANALFRFLARNHKSANDEELKSGDEQTGNLAH